MLVIFAAALIVAVVGGHTALLTRQQSGGGAVAVRADPLRCLIDALCRRRWMRRSLSLGSLAAFGFAVAMLGYPFYTNLVQSRLQSRLGHQLQSPELKQAYVAKQVHEGDSLTRIEIPSIGVDVVVVQGTGADALRAGAGHYTATPLPCENGNVGIAGHRTTYGHPFTNLDQLRPGDQITLETPIGSCTYQVLPAPAGRHALDGRSAAFVVAPDAVDVVGTPDRARAGDGAMPNAMLTLTTCHPKGSASQRLVVQAVLANAQPTSPPGA